MSNIIRKYRYRTPEECRLLGLIPREEMEIKLLDISRSITNLYVVYEDTLLSDELFPDDPNDIAPQGPFGR